MRDLYELLKELVGFFKFKPKTKKRISLSLLLLFIFFIVFFIIKNNFFENKFKKNINTNVNVSNSENAIINTGNVDKIVQDNSSNYYLKNDINIREIIEDYFKNPDIYYIYYTIIKEGYIPYYILAYSKLDSIYFESFKIKNGKVSIVHSLKARGLEFRVSSWSFKPIRVNPSWLDSFINNYLVFTGCRPQACNSEFGIYVYSLKYDEGYAISTNDTIGFSIFNLPIKSDVMCDFENIILNNHPELLNTIKLKGSIFDSFPSRQLPNLLDSVIIKDKVLLKIKDFIEDTIKNPESINRLKVYGLYRENFFRKGLCWLVSSAFDDSLLTNSPVLYCFFNDKFDLIYSFRSSYLNFDTGDVYLVKQGSENQRKVYYLMIVKDCGGTSGIRDIWMYKIVENKLVKINDVKFIESYISQFEINHYYIIH